MLLAIACIALYVMKLSGAWRWIYALTALISLYFNVFVLVIQSFLKIPALTALAPGNPPSGPVFAVVQGIVLLFFVVVIIGAVRRFRPAAAYARTTAFDAVRRARSARLRRVRCARSSCGDCIIAAAKRAARFRFTGAGGSRV